MFFELLFFFYFPIYTMTSRNYCFTSFAFDEVRLEFVESIVKFMEDIKFIIWQLEAAKSTGRKHIQGYVEFGKPMRWKAAKEIFKDELVHLECRRGTRESAISYCEKAETKIKGPFEYGNRGITQGHRSDFDEIRDKLKCGLELKDIAEKHPGDYLRYHRGIEKMKSLLDENLNWRKVETFIYWGETGTGKTRKAVEDNVSSYYILDLIENGGTWFDNYCGESCLIIDDFYGQLKAEKLLHWLDGYKRLLPTKGGSVYAKWKKVIITSNVHPDEWYQSIPEKVKDALKRRYTEIVKFEKKNI